MSGSGEARWAVSAVVQLTDGLIPYLIELDMKVLIIT